MQNFTEPAMETAHAVRGWTALAPHVGIVLGSGLGPIADRVENAVRISTASLPHFPRSTVAGHAGELVVGLLSGRPVAVLSGRVHGYEGYSGAQIAFPVRLLHALGCRDVIVTNAAGALNPGFAPGEVMILDDHLSLPSLAGLSPLVGEASSASRPRFVDLTNAYAPALRQIAERAAEEARIEVRHGVYVMVGGPNFETPAEVCFLRAAGGDAVGMSTVPEVIVARQLGMRVLGLSVISNRAAGLPGASLTHDDVLATVARAVPAVARIIDGVLVRLAT